VACLGVAKTVKDLQTESGVKDGYTQSWIESLLMRSSTMQSSQNRDARNVQIELMKWVDENRTTIINPFLTLEGKV
jgi:hypothetical protein